jgi:LAO/AO transport system kinase
MGDDIQAIKAGILEIGDVFAINKADRDGADKLDRELNMMLDLDDKKSSDWRPPIKQTVAHQNKGIVELIDTLYEHFEHVKANGQLTQKRKQRMKNELLDILNTEISRRVLDKVTEGGSLDNIVDDIRDRKTDPYTVVNQIVESTLK